MTDEFYTRYYNRPKSEWIKKGIIKTKALMPHSSCREIEECFNRRFAQSKKMTVGKLVVIKPLINEWYFFKTAVFIAEKGFGQLDGTPRIL